MSLAVLFSCTGQNTPKVSIALNAISDDLDDLLIVPPSGWVVNLTLTPAAGQTIDPNSLVVLLYPWSGGSPVDVSADFSTGGESAVGVISSYPALVEGTYTLTASIDDLAGRTGVSAFDLALRDHPGGPPLGSGQQIWFDFSFDRDSSGDPDFMDDLFGVGLGSAADPLLSAQVEADVIGRILDRVADVYDDDPSGLGSDPVEVSFSSSDPGSGDVTRICVGGTYSYYPSLIGSILIDPDNANRNSVECASLPPTGVFSGGMLVAYGGNSHFEQTFDPLMTSRGGTPVGEHALDPIVLDPGWDPGSAPQPEIDRFDDIDHAVQVYADALGTVVAHETGHALGLVAPGTPGIGLHGGVSGASYSHDVDSQGATPAENWVMKEGGSLNFQKLAGLAGKPLLTFRPLDYAYLRDRVVRDPDVQTLLFPPVATSASPTFIDDDTLITVTGENFVSGLRIEIQNFGLSYGLLFEQVLDPQTATALLSHAQIVEGLYWVLVINPDGQLASPPDLIYVDQP